MRIRSSQLKTIPGEEADQGFLQMTRTTAKVIKVIEAGDAIDGAGGFTGWGGRSGSQRERQNGAFSVRAVKVTLVGKGHDGKGVGTRDGGNWLHKNARQRLALFATTAHNFLRTTKKQVVSGSAERADNRNLTLGDTAVRSELALFARAEFRFQQARDEMGLFQNKILRQTGGDGETAGAKERFCSTETRCQEGRKKFWVNSRSAGEH